jgi:hypothetical protein
MNNKNTQNEGAETPVVPQSNEAKIPWWEQPVIRNPRPWYDDDNDGEEYILKRDGSYSRVRL